MIDLSGVARHLRLSVEQIRVAADLLEQGYQPGFIERYRADESGNLPRSTLWLLKLEIDRQIRLQAARDKAANQLPKDAELDAEAKKFLEKATTEVEIEAALRAFRSRRALSQNQETDKQASQLLEKMIEYQGEAIEDLVAWSAQQLSVDSAAAELSLQQAARLVGMLMHSDSNLNENLRRTIQRRADVRVELCDPTHVDAEDQNADGSASDASPNETELHAGEAELDDASIHASYESADSEIADEEKDVEKSEEQAPEAGVPDSSDTQISDVDAVQPAFETTAGGEMLDTPQDAVSGNAAVSNSDASEPAAATAESESPQSENSQPNADLSAPAADPAAELAFTPGGKKADKKLGRGVKTKASKPAQKPVAKMTPRQRRRRWLVAMLQPMKSLKRPLSKLSSYQHLMLGRGRRSQLVKTELLYDRSALVALARDTFVSDKHPLAKWFVKAAEDALDHSLRAKVEMDAVTDLEEIAAERLLETSVDQLRQSLMQRPVRGHCILVVDAVGPKAAAVAVVDPQGQVLAVEEIPCSASPGIVNQNVVRLGELVHQYRVTLIALTNGPARRFLVLSLRELVKQSASSGLRWTMADRSGADAYAVGRSALKELAAHNRRHRAAIWIGRCLQDPLSELLKVDINRLRLGSFQRELPQEPLKKLVRETIADCICQRGIDTLSATAEQLQCVSGVGIAHAQQITSLAAQGGLTSRKALLASTADWSESDSRQAIAQLRIYGSDQPLDATIIHPDDYRLAERLIENTDLVMPPNAPDGWVKPKAAGPNADIGSQSAENIPANEPSADQDSSVAPESSVPSPVDAAGTEANSSETISSDTESPIGENSAGPESSSPTDAASPSDGQAEAPESSSVQSVDSNAAIAPAASSADVPLNSMPPEYPENLEPISTTPPTVDVEKLARGWQVGREKLRWVASCLNDPFADPRLSRPPVPLMSEMPTLGNLQPGMCVWAIVIGVADFGAFVELAPDCSGLIHISRLSASYVEDPHQCVQVGDLVMAWVVSVDEKKNRVALTALSPEQRAAAEAEAAARKAEHEEHRRRDRGGPAMGGQRAVGAGAGAGSQTAGQSSGQGRSQPRSGGGDGRRGGGGTSDRGSRSGGGQSRGGYQSGGRGKGRPPQTKSIVVTSKKPKANITEAMKEGEEPLRSFSDLLQFYEAKRTDEPPTGKSTENSPSNE